MLTSQLQNAKSLVAGTRNTKKLKVRLVIITFLVIFLLYGKTSGEKKANLTSAQQSMYYIWWRTCL